MTSTWVLAESESKPEPAVTDAAARGTLVQKAAAQLVGIVPEPGSAEQKSAVKNGLYLLWGELFEKGRTHAVVELGEPGTVDFEESANSHLALAAWDAKDAGWQVQQVIHGPILWKSPSVKESGWVAGLDNVPEKAFWVHQPAPSWPTLLVVSTPYSRYRAARLVLTYDSQQHQFRKETLFSVDDPALRQGHLVLTSDSGNKAWYAGESYYATEQGRLKFRGSVRTGTFRGDDIHIHVGFTKPGSPDKVTWRFDASPEDQSIFKIQAGREGPAQDEDPVLGHIRFRNSTSDLPEDQAAYLLHKLAGLPATLMNPNLYTGRDPLVPIPTLTDRDVAVTGNEEVMRLLGPGPTSAAKPVKGK
ncbi:MAG: hypothetical protein ACAH88_10595 [Roseimicrobium sp.]